VHPNTRYGHEAQAFLSRYGDELGKAGIPMDRWAREQVEMRLGFARRLRRLLPTVRPRLASLGVRWAAWMEHVMLYYYYPEKLRHASAWVHQLAEVLVACEQFEAYSNRQRGRDYYARQRETLMDAFAYLDKLKVEGIVTAPVLEALRGLAAEGAFDRILAEARGGPLTRREERYLKSLRQGAAACR
jgi:hypothetical protein